jgi:hypothetical protein
MENQKLEALVNPEAPKRPPLIINEKAIMHYAKWLFNSYKETPDQRWNGRQIRNAFQMAYSLANFDLQKTSLEHWDDEGEVSVDVNASDSETVDGRPAAAQLDHEQFMIVAKAIEKFDRYLDDTRQGTETDHARSTAIRADDHDPNVWDEGPVYHAPYPGYRHHSNEPTHHKSRQRMSNDHIRSSQTRGEYTRRAQPQRGSLSPQQVYQPPKQEYHPPKSKRRAAPEGTPQRDNDRLRARASSSKLVPRSRPISGQRDDSGYSGSTYNTQNPAMLSGDEYPPEIEINGEYHSQEFSDGGEQFYEEDDDDDEGR